MSSLVSTFDEKFWDQIAQKYAKSPIKDEAAYEHTLERVASYLRPEHRVLELGCGTGATAVKLAPYAAEILATDLSPAMCDIGRRRAAEAGVSNLRFEANVPGQAPEGPFDVVMGFNLFHLVPDLESDLSAVASRVKPGGLFISKTPCLSDAKSFGLRVGARLAMPVMKLIGKAPKVVRFLTVRDWQATVEAAGFELIETGSFPKEPPARFLVARRL